MIPIRHIVLALTLVVAVLGACTPPAQSPQAPEVPGEPQTVATAPREPGTDSQPTPRADTGAPLPPDPSGYAASGAVEYYYYDERPDRGEGPEQPSFRVRTPHMEWIKEGAESEVGSATFRDAEATIFSTEGPDTVLRAGEGRLNPDARTASLTNGVSLERGSLRVELDDIVWDDGERRARSDRPVRITDGANNIEATTFEYYPVGEIINLTGVTGTVALNPAPAAGDALPPPVDEASEGVAESEAGLTSGPVAFAKAEFDRMAIESAPVVHMVRQRFETITGGVALALQADKPDTPPLTISASEAGFTYSSDRDMLPAEVVLRGDVSLQGQMGSMSSGSARLDLRSKRFQFEGHVKGSTPEIERFEAQTLVYEPGLITLDGGVYVKHADGSVEAGQGRLDAEADVMTFAGSVHLTNAEGDIRAEQAVLDNARDLMILTGRVSGDLSEIRGFTADRIEYALNSGDADMTNLRVSRVDLGGRAEAAPGDGAGQMSFSAMAIERAPAVRVVARRVQSINGGVGFRLQPADAALEPLHVTADESRFDYAEGSKDNLPSTVRLAGNVHVEGPVGGMNSTIRSAEAEMQPADKRFVFRGDVQGSTPDIPSFRADVLTYADDVIRLDGGGERRVEVEHEQGTITAERAEMAMATRVMIFTGSVQGSMPQVRGVVADRLVYDPAAGSISLDRATIDEVRREGGESEMERAWMLDAADVTDWPSLIRRLQSGPTATTATPESRIASLFPEAVREALGRLSVDRPPNPSTRERIVDEVNALLVRPDLYEREAWSSAGLPSGLIASLSALSDKSEEVEVARVNRRLLEAAFPEAIAVHDESAPPPEAGSGDK